jgi:hypothetical protein
MSKHPQAFNETPSLEQYLLQGATEITQFVFGPPANKREADCNRQRAYRAIERSDIPAFRIGGMIHARKSTILRHIEALERKAAS